MSGDRVKDPLGRFVHDVDAKCASLKDATALLRGASAKNSAELLELMARQAESLGRVISDYAKKQGA
jgi:hypothetical protein